MSRVCLHVRGWCSDLHLGAPDGRGRSSDRQMCKVASWAVGFERLLEDPTGIEYFTVSQPLTSIPLELMWVLSCIRLLYFSWMSLMVHIF